MLVDTGRLANSLSHEATDTQVAIGTNVLYAAIHQFGGTIKAKNGEALHFKLGSRDILAESVEIPARPFLGFDRDDDAILTGVVETYLSKVLGETEKSG